MDKYNGWTNYETWLVKLWIDNGQGEHEYWQEQAQEVFEAASPSEIFTKSQQARYALAKMLRIETENNTPTVEGLYADLITAALCEVEWREIANALLEDAETRDGEKYEYEK